MPPRIHLPVDRIRDFCERWKIVEFSLFGSVLRDDFRPDSDVDTLVTFAEDVRWSLLDHVRVLEELRGIFGREVDMAQERLLENPYRRHEILRTRERVYAA